MRKIEEYLKNYFKKELRNIEKTPQCLDQEVLMDYLRDKLDDQERKDVEEHFSQCNFCLSQLNLAFEAKKSNIRNIGGKVPSGLVNEAKALLKDDKSITGRGKGNRMKKNLFFAGAVVFFIISFLLPKYFIQCLVVTLVLGMRWSFESENGRTFIMVIDSWRRHSHDEDDEISNRLKDRFKSPHF
ncbi:MAG: zf-HC2 domain-containing protein [Candidatus Omnitrophica bacterium]|nr:zf-HC2 domain-containing protein [Candidatus Omnitrophota bacterium]